MKNIENSVETIVSEVGNEISGNSIKSNFAKIVSKIIVKWGVSIMTTLIGGAFIYGQFHMNKLNSLDDMKKSLDLNTKAISDLNEKYQTSNDKTNARIDKIYKDGYATFIDFQSYNKKQLELIIDYGYSNKELLKKILDANSTEKSINIENQLNKAKLESDLITVPVSRKNEYVSYLTAINNFKDTTFYIIGATKAYYDKIDKNKYEVSKPINNNKYPGLLDFNFRNK